MIPFWKARLVLPFSAKHHLQSVVLEWHRQAHPSCKATYDQPCARITAFVDGIKFSRINPLRLSTIGYSMDAEILVRQGD